MSEFDPVPIVLTINGTQYRLFAEPRRLLSDVLRDDCGLTGTHVGCEHGVCGACTILLDGAPARACLTYAVQVQDHEITTIEAFGGDGALSPVQQALHEEHGLQCGFCTPGIVVTMEAWLDGKSRPDRSGDPRRAVRQSVPLHRLPQHRRGDRARPRPGGARAARHERNAHHRQGRCCAARTIASSPDRAAISTMSWCRVPCTRISFARRTRMHGSARSTSKPRAGPRASSPSSAGVNSRNGPRRCAWRRRSRACARSSFRRCRSTRSASSAIPCCASSRGTATSRRTPPSS